MQAEFDREIRLPHRRESCDRVREPIRIFIESIPPPKPPEVCEAISEEEGEIKGAEEAQEMGGRSEAAKGHRHRPWARRGVISGRKQSWKLGCFQI